MRIIFLTSRTLCCFEDCGGFFSLDVVGSHFNSRKEEEKKPRPRFQEVPIEHFWFFFGRGVGGLTCVPPPFSPFLDIFLANKRKRVGCGHQSFFSTFFGGLTAAAAAQGVNSVEKFSDCTCSSSRVADDDQLFPVTFAFLKINNDSGRIFRRFSPVFFSRRIWMRFPFLSYLSLSCLLCLAVLSISRSFFWWRGISEFQSCRLGNQSDAAAVFEAS